MLNSSGGFATPTAALSSTSSDITPSYSPPPTISLTKQPSNNHIFILGDDELSSPSSRSASYRVDRPNSSSEDPLSPVSSTDPFSPEINASQQELSNSLSSQQHSSGIVHTAPMYISAYSSTPSISRIKDTNSSPPINDDESFFTRRSPPSIVRKIEQSNNTFKHIITTSMRHPSDLNSQQQVPSSATYKYHRFPATSFEEQEKL